MWVKIKMKNQTSYGSSFLLHLLNLFNDSNFVYKWQFNCSWISEGFSLVYLSDEGDMKVSSSIYYNTGLVTSSKNLSKLGAFTSNYAVILLLLLFRENGIKLSKNSCLWNNIITIWKPWKNHLNLCIFEIFASKKRSQLGMMS